MSLDLSSLPAPAVVQVLDYEAVLAGLRADLIARHPAAAEVLAKCRPVAPPRLSTR